MSFNPLFVGPSEHQPSVQTSENFVGFIGDSDSVDILRQALGPAFPEGIQLHETDFRSALAILDKIKSPDIILIDISGEDQPLNALMDLAEVVAPRTLVFVLGEANKVSIYRTITKGMGIKEYMVKPLTVENVRACFANVTCGDIKTAMSAIKPRTGRIVAIAGMRGGVGCSTIATNLAWIIGTENRRHTLLLDADVYTGTDALYLNLKQNIGLYTALETPDRIDNLLIERSAQSMGTRLQVLSSNAELEKEILYSRSSAVNLVQTLNARFTSVIADIGSQLLPFARDLLYLVNQAVVVMDPSKISIRNWERFQTLPGSPTQSHRRILVLNQAGYPGGLSQSVIEHDIGRQFDIVIPDLPHVIFGATQLGTPAARLRGPFRNAISQLAIAVNAAKVRSTKDR